MQVILFDINWLESVGDYLILVKIYYRYLPIIRLFRLFHSIKVLLQLSLLLFPVPSVYLLILSLQLGNLFLRVFALALQLSNSLHHAILIPRRLKCLPHPESYRTFI